MPASNLKSSIKRDSPDFQKNSRRIIELLTEIKNQDEQIRQGGGPKAIESQHKKGRLTARERVAKLIDPSSYFFELGAFASLSLDAVYSTHLFVRELRACFDPEVFHRYRLP